MSMSQFWTPIGVADLRELQALHDMILTRGAKRMPKWKFRLADDVVVQIHAKPGRREFICHAVIKDDAGATDIVAKRLDAGWIFDFKLFFAETGWSLRPRRIGNRSGLDHDEAFKIKQRIVDLLPQCFDALDPKSMFVGFCVCCGREMTNPISQSRWIGPECYGSATADLPFVKRLVAA